MRTLALSLAALALTACGSTSLDVGMNSSAAKNSSFTSLGSASSFALLGGPGVTCTDSTVLGDVGAGFPGAPVTQTNCPITGAVHAGDATAIAAYADFRAGWTAYGAYGSCDTAHTLTGTLAGVTLSPGTYCVDAVAKTGVLTLDGAGNTNAQWIFIVGANGTGALTGTNFTVLMANGASSCNVIWRVAQATTMTTSNFIGTILSGAAITMTGGTLYGDALATDAVTVTGAAITGCAAGSSAPAPKSKCNQGLGNGAEGCDPGNSNNHNPSNDENGGTPGNGGRK